MKPNVLEAQRELFAAERIVGRHKMPRMQRTSAYHRAEEGSNSKIHKIVIAANQQSRNAFFELDLAGVDFTNYKRNPVVLWGHDDGSFFSNGAAGGVPIARTLRIGRDDEDRILAEFEFLQGDDFAQKVENAWDQGFLQAASIRWMPIKTRELDNGNVLSEESDMLEWSIVSIPADPDTLKLMARQFGLPEEMFVKKPQTPKPRTVAEKLEVILEAIGRCALDADFDKVRARQDGIDEEIEEIKARLDVIEEKVGIDDEDEEEEDPDMEDTDEDEEVEQVLFEDEDVHSLVDDILTLIEDSKSGDDKGTEAPE